MCLYECACVVRDCEQGLNMEALQQGKQYLLCYENEVYNRNTFRSSGAAY